jgi:hypothetical protein
MFYLTGLAAFTEYALIFISILLLMIAPVFIIRLVQRIRKHWKFRFSEQVSVENGSNDNSLYHSTQSGFSQAIFLFNNGHCLPVKDSGSNSNVPFEKAISYCEPVSIKGGQL